MRCTLLTEDWKILALRLMVSGDVDMLTAPDLQIALADALGRRPERLRVDLNDVGVLSAAAISVLLQAAKVGAAHGIAYEVVDGSATRRRIVRALGLADALALRTDEAPTSSRND